jgi:UbiD family decarboxylase
LDLRDTIERLRALSELRSIVEPVETVHGMARFMKRFDKEAALLFENVRGFSNRVVAGVCGTKRRLACTLGVAEEEIYDKINKSIGSPLPPTIRSDGPVAEIESEPNLRKLPILTHYEKDPAPYITSAIVSALLPDRKIENVSVHRMMVLDDNHLAIRIVPRHLYRMCELAKRDGMKELDIAISIGVHPSILMAASSPAPFGVSEYGVANALGGGRVTLIECRHVNAHAPSDAEIVLEGRIILDKEVDEGPFVDLTGTYDIVRRQPVVELVGMMHRKDFVYQALLPAGAEHRLLMGLPYEARIWNAVKTTIPGLRAVSLTHGGCGWLHAVLSLDKQTDGDGKSAILAAFGAHPSLKHVVVVDADIDVNDPTEVEWAIATRFRSDKGLVTVAEARSSSLDPSSNQEALTGAKMGLDATIPLTARREKFQKARIPE